MQQIFKFSQKYILILNPSNLYPQIKILETSQSFFVENMPFSSIHFSQRFSQLKSRVSYLPRFFIDRYTFNDNVIEITVQRLEDNIADSGLFVYPTLTR